MHIIRKLFYKEKALSDFEIYDEGTIDYVIFENLLLISGFTYNDYGSEDMIKQLFNDASYICTLVVDCYKHPYLHIGEFERSVSPNIDFNICYSQTELEDISDFSFRYSSLVLIVTYCLLRHIKNWDTELRIRRTVDVLENKLKDSRKDIRLLFEEFSKITSAIEKYSPIDMYLKNKITNNTLVNINWANETNGYNIADIKSIFSFIPTNMEKALFLDSIETEVKNAYNNDFDINLPF